jgi:hypothetical protein
VKLRLSNHAAKEINRRNIPETLLDELLDNPQQRTEEKDRLVAYQSQFDFGEGKVYLIRVIVDEAQDPNLVVTVYKTSKMDKYWRQS